jgi:1,4-alpha-glucan branching enzyme
MKSMHSIPLGVSGKAFNRRDDDWTQTILYERRVGKFTAGGCFVATAMQLFDYLLEFAVSAIERMPITDFPGKRIWAYNDILLIASLDVCRPGVLPDSLRIGRS